MYAGISFTKKERDYINKLWTGSGFTSSSTTDTKGESHWVSITVNGDIYCNNPYPEKEEEKKEKVQLRLPGNYRLRDFNEKIKKI